MRILRLEDIDPKDLSYRGSSEHEGIKARVKDILGLVQRDGDKALLELTRRFDGADLDDLMVSGEEMDAATEGVSEEVKEALSVCIENVKVFHQAQRRAREELGSEGIEMGRMFVPLGSVGIYVPGGKASYPSTVIMGAIPAKTAGVEHVVVCTPPDRDGRISKEVLLAARMCGVNAVYKVGGAQAIGALAFGTNTVPKVDKIVGPGNDYVVAAKTLVREQVSLDFTAGPSEILIIADKDANTSFIAVDLVAQAEHDEAAVCTLVTPSAELAVEVKEQVDQELRACHRGTIASKAIEDHGRIIVVKDVDQAFEISNVMAPEHLVIMLPSPKGYLERVKNAGSVFLGSYSTVAAGDYCTGPNHILPTRGQARASSGLSVDDFQKGIYYQKVNHQGLARLRPTIGTMASVEGFLAHKGSVDRRMVDRDR